MRKRFTVYLIFALSIAGLAVTVNAGSAYAQQEELIVSAAASLTNAFTEIGKAFESADRGAKITLNFAASGALLQQIEQGAPVDVFASADQKTMDQAREKNLLLAGSRKDFAGNSLVLIVPKDSRLPIESPGDLTGKDVARVSLGKPESVPAGRYTEESLRNERLWDTLQPKFIFGNSVRQVLDYVNRGEVDAGFVFATDAAAAKDKVRIITKMEKHKPIVYPLAVIAATRKKEAAQRFVDFVLSGDGREILSRYGFGEP